MLPAMKVTYTAPTSTKQIVTNFAIEIEPFCNRHSQTTWMKHNVSSVSKNEPDVKVLLMSSAHPVET